MKIDTSNPWWQVSLVLLSVLVGIILTSVYGWATQVTREITIYRNEARSDADLPGYFPDSGTKQISIHEFIVKNTGDEAFDQLVVRLSPEGSDSAYDNGNVQQVQVSGIRSPQAIPGDVQVTRDRNAVIVNLREVQPSEEFGFTITNDGTADSYQPSVLPANIRLRVNEAHQWKPQEFSELSLTVRMLLIASYIVVTLQCLFFLFLFARFMVRKIQENG